MDNKEKTYTTDWKFFKNYIIYVNERNTKVDEDKYEKKCYIGLLDQSQKRLDLLSNRIDKSLYTIYIHNSYLDVLDLDFVKKYEESNKSLLDCEDFTLYKTSEFKIEDKRISFLVYIMSSFFHINNLHTNLIATEDNFDFVKNKDYNIHQLYIDDLFLYILLKAIQLIRTPSNLKHNFINELIKEYNLALKYYCKRLENLHLKTTSENFMNLFSHNSYLFSSIENVNESIFTKDITLEYENSIDIKDYYSDFTESDISLMLTIVCNLFKNNFQGDNYKKNTFKTVKDDYSYIHLKNKFDERIINIDNTFENIYSHIKKYTKDDNSDKDKGKDIYSNTDTIAITLKYIEEINYCIFLLKDLRSELKKFFPTNIKSDTRTKINSLREHIRNSINSLNASSRILNILLLTENTNSRKNLNSKLNSYIKIASLHMKSISQKLKYLYTKQDTLKDLSTKSIVKFLSEENITTANLSTLQEKLKKKLKNSNNATTTLLSFIELFNLEQYSILDSLIIINPEIKSIYLELAKDINKESVNNYPNPFPFIISIL